MVCRILVADDSATIQKVIRIGLAVIPNDIRAVGSLAESMKASEPGKFDLIIADAGLPGVSAATDFIKLSERCGAVPIIILMGSYDAVREVDLRAAGLSHIIKKPFPPGELPQIVQQIMGSALKSAPVDSSQASVRTTATTSNVPMFSLDDEVTQVKFAIDDPTEMARASSVAESGFLPGIPTPSPEVEPARKGRPAFDLSADTFAKPSKQDLSLELPDNRPITPSPQRGVMETNVKGAVEEIIRDTLPDLVDQAVQKYCSENFKGVAREVLTSELRRLAEEKARYLVDQ